MNSKLQNTEYLLGLMDEQSTKSKQKILYSNIFEYSKLNQSKKIVGEIVSDIKIENEILISKDLVLKKALSTHSGRDKSRANFFRKKYIVQLLTVAATFFVILNFNIVQNPIDDSSETSYAVLSSTTHSSSWFANIDNKGISLIPVNSYIKQSSSDFELWAITKNKQVISLGLIPEGKLILIKLEDIANLSNDKIVAIAISKELEGGSKSGKPKGEILYNSKFLKANKI